MFGKISGSVTIRVEAMVFGKATVFKTFSLDVELCLSARYQWLQGAAVLVPSSAHPTCHPTAETIALVQNQECVGMAVHLHSFQGFLEG